MKKLTILFLLTAIGLQAQTPSWAWARSFGDYTWDHGLAAEKDQLGNVYIGGTFASYSIAVGSTTLYCASPNKDDIFIAKYDQNGNVLWARSFGGAEMDGANNITTDLNNNCIITGGFSSPTIAIGSFTLTRVGSLLNSDIFIAKLDPSGNVLWAKSYGSSNSGLDQGYALGADPGGNVILNAQYSGTTITVGTNTIVATSTFNPCHFLSKYDQNGNLLWAKNSAPISVGSLAVDNTGNIYGGGVYNAPVITVETNTFTNSSAGTFNDILFSKYDTNGNLVWIKTSNGANAETVTSVKTDNANNVYFCGNSTSSVTAIGNLTINIASSAGLLGKYDPSGNFLWIRQGLSSNTNNPYDISTTNNGYVYMSGIFTGSTASFGTTTVTGTGFWNSFITKHDTSGALTWATAYSANNSVVADEIVGNNNSAYVFGSFSCNPTLAIGATTLNFKGGYDVYLAKLDEISTGIEVSKKTKNINIYPNPNNGTFIITSDLIEEQEISIYDLIGQKIHSQQLRVGENKIQLNTQSKGLYYYSIEKNNQKSTVGKIIIE